MKKVNLITLMSLINQLENEASSKSYQIRNNSYLEVDKELDGTETITKDCENFQELYVNYLKVLQTLTDYKLKLNEANNIVNAQVGYSVSELLIHIKQLRVHLGLIETLTKNTETKRRINTEGVSYYSIKKLNYDIKEINNIKDTLVKNINSLEEKINTINSTTFVEIKE